MSAEITRKEIAARLEGLRKAYGFLRGSFPVSGFADHASCLIDPASVAWMLEQEDGTAQVCLKGTRGDSLLKTREGFGKAKKAVIGTLKEGDVALEGTYDHARADYLNGLPHLEMVEKRAMAILGRTDILSMTGGTWGHGIMSAKIVEGYIMSLDAENAEKLITWISTADQRRHGGAKEG